MPGAPSGGGPRRPLASTEAVDGKLNVSALANGMVSEPTPFASLADLGNVVVRCRRCPRLVAWREEVARTRRAAFADQEYWGRPVPSFGDPAARLLVVGLAPAAHGGNRTGRIFTGDRSGDWLFRALHRAGFASQPHSVSRDDGLTLTDCYVTASVRCAPPGNQPLPSERANCQPYLEAELGLLPGLRAVVALGGFTWTQLLRVLPAIGWDAPRPKPAFAHGVEAVARRPDGTPVQLIASYHPSQRNTFTGTLTEEMFDAVWARARELLDAR